MSVTITPTSATSKILISSSFIVLASAGTGLYYAGQMKLVRGATDIISPLIGGYYPGGGNVNTAFYIPVTISQIDSPASTSALTYKVQINNLISSGNFNLNPGANSIQITAMEILA